MMSRVIIYVLELDNCADGKSEEPRACHASCVSELSVGMEGMRKVGTYHLSPISLGILSPMVEISCLIVNLVTCDADYSNDRQAADLSSIEMCCQNFLTLPNQV